MSGTKCPDYEQCDAKVDSKHHKNYCLNLPTFKGGDDEMGYYRCYYYEQSHPKTTKKPRQWGAPKRVTIKCVTSILPDDPHKGNVKP